ncbi:DWNN-domain-containing protein [Teratosphaeria nubilosa]|uniref:DWNN-domain-containing protein n=1 Tax=Teratosphaeria nubilosa TaxID=161662 RepID=A0A6G1LK33_9PEZI|nr:DWNN-domain-containing protein [Teratosphaeria nubilosa]
MSSTIFFRFPNSKTSEQITFDGASLSVFEVKRDIIAIARLGDGKDFDLDIENPDKELYKDDTEQIPRSSTVIAKRKPAQRPGAGRAARYVSGNMPASAKNQHRIESTPVASSKGAPVSLNSSKAMTEEEKLAKLMGEEKDIFAKEQAGAKPMLRSVNNKPAPPSDKPVPPNYTCHRCGEKGHWIQNCPTNGNPDLDGRNKIRRTTGIPRSFLKKIDESQLVTDENGKVDLSKLPPGAMRNPEGEWVLATQDTASFDKFKESHNAAAAKAKEASEDVNELRKRGLLCDIGEHGYSADEGHARRPVKTPCCGNRYSFECIETALLDSDFVCPNCAEKDVFVEGLVEDEETRAKMKEYLNEKASKQAEKEKSRSPAPASAPSPKAGSVKSPSVGAAVPEVKGNGTMSTSSTPTSKKRGAEDELENNRKPAGPAEMQRAGSKQGTPTPVPTAPTIPTGPKADREAQAAQQAAQNGMNNFKIANNMQDFVRQMEAMGGAMPGSMNPMMNGFNPAMMGGMGMGGFPMGGMMGGFNPMMMSGMGGMGGFGPMNGGMGMNGFGGGMPNGGAWQGQQQAGWGGNMDQGVADGAYMRQPVNPQRQMNRNRRQQRSVDYKQMGS